MTDKLRTHISYIYLSMVAWFRYENLQPSISSPFFSKNLE